MKEERKWGGREEKNERNEYVNAVWIRKIIGSIDLLRIVKNGELVVLVKS